MSIPSESSEDPSGLQKILSESNRISRAQPYHFQGLKLLFFLPLSFCISISPIILQIFSNSTHKDPNPKTHIQNLLIILFYSLFTTLFYICAVSTFSYSSFHGFFGKHVNLISSTKSISHSFFPLLSTFIVTQLILILISVPFVILLILVYQLLPSYFMTFLIIAVFVFCIVLIYLQLNWLLAYVVVVLESRWGYEPLKRSAYLMKRMHTKGLGFELISIYGSIFLGFWGGYYYIAFSGYNYMLGVIFGSIYLTFFLPDSLVATLVLYLYCLAENGELRLEH